MWLYTSNDTASAGAYLVWQAYCLVHAALNVHHHPVRTAGAVSVLERLAHHLDLCAHKVDKSGFMRRQSRDRRTLAQPCGSLWPSSCWYYAAVVSSGCWLTPVLQQLVAGLDQFSCRQCPARTSALLPPSKVNGAGLVWSLSKFNSHNPCKKERTAWCQSLLRKQAQLQRPGNKRYWRPHAAVGQALTVEIPPDHVARQHANKLVPRTCLLLRTLK